MTGPVFVDANVLVYDRDRRDPSKHERAQAWMSALWQHPGLGVVSSQVLTEFYWTVTRKLRPGLDEEAARRYVRALLAWESVATDQAAIIDAWTVQDRFGFSFWDSLVVAAARIGRCRILLTEDLQDHQDLDGLLVVNPFTHSPDDWTKRAQD
jgi:predicted nucleic acid-binding protein